MAKVHWNDNLSRRWGDGYPRCNFWGRSMPYYHGQTNEPTVTKDRSKVTCKRCLAALDKEDRGDG